MGRRTRATVFAGGVLLGGVALLLMAVPLISADSDVSRTHYLCWRGSSDYEMALVFCDEEDDRDVDIEWYCFKSEVCQDWKSPNRRCPVVKGCATLANCTTPSGATMQGETETAGALTIQTWCAKADSSAEYDMLSLRQPTNGARSCRPISYHTASKSVCMALALFGAYVAMGAALAADSFQ